MSEPLMSEICHQPTSKHDLLMDSRLDKMLSGHGDWNAVCFFNVVVFCGGATCELLDTSVLDLIIPLEIHCHFNVVTLFSPYCIEKKSIPGVQPYACTRTNTASCPHALAQMCTHTGKGHVDQPDVTRKIQHALQLWDSYRFLVHRLIDFAFLRLQIDGNSWGFLMGFNPGVCLAVSKGLSVLCALITYDSLSLQTQCCVDFLREATEA